MALFFEEARVAPRENDSTARTDDNAAVAVCDPPADTDAVDAVDADRREPIVMEADDREEAGYGHGV
jgi:hypothetical protein